MLRDPGGNRGLRILRPDFSMSWGEGPYHQ